MIITQKLKKIICAAVAILLLIANVTGAAFAVEEKYDYSILADKALSSLEVSEDLSEYLIKHAGNSEEDWIALYLSASGQGESYRLDEYLSALENKLTSTAPAMDRLRMSLLLAVMGENPDYIQKTIYECIDKLGIMSNIYGLMLALSTDLNDVDFIANKTATLIGLQNANGGFGLSNVPDTDITAMAIYSLSFEKDTPQVKAAIDKATLFLSERQKASGGFTSFGIETAEGSAQVILALCSVGINPETDTRFIKNGNSVVDALLSYVKESGGFSHTISGSENIKATSQAMLAIYACERFFNGEKFIFDSDLTLVKAPLTTDEETTKTETTATGEQNRNIKDGEYYKLITILCVTAFFALLIVSKAVTKRLNIRKAVALVLLAALCISFLSFLKFQSREEYYVVNTETTHAHSISVSLTIDCKEAQGINTYTHYPQNGVVFADNVFLDGGESVFDLLLKITKSQQINLDYNESFGSVYIKGINYLNEFDGGANSGWMYTVNGQSAGDSINKYALSDGDIVKITFVSDYVDVTSGGAK